MDHACPEYVLCQCGVQCPLYILLVCRILCIVCSQLHLAISMYHMSAIGKAALGLPFGNPTLPFARPTDTPQCPMYALQTPSTALCTPCRHTQPSCLGQNVLIVDEYAHVCGQKYVEMD